MVEQSEDVALKKHSTRAFLQRDPADSLEAAERIEKLQEVKK